MELCWYSDASEGRGKDPVVRIRGTRWSFFKLYLLNLKIVVFSLSYHFLL